jgi:hypothetical protein
MTENHKVRNIRLRKAVYDYLCEVRAEATLEKRLQRLKKLKQEVVDIFHYEYIQTNFERIKNNLIHAQNNPANFSDRYIKSFIIRQRQKHIDSLKLYHLS